MFLTVIGFIAVDVNKGNRLDRNADPAFPDRPGEVIPYRRCHPLPAGKASEDSESAGGPDVAAQWIWNIRALYAVWMNRKHYVLQTFRKKCPVICLSSEEISCVFTALGVTSIQRLDHREQEIQKFINGNRFHQPAAPVFPDFYLLVFINHSGILREIICK